MQFVICYDFNTIYFNVDKIQQQRAKNKVNKSPVEDKTNAHQHTELMRLCSVTYYVFQEFEIPKTPFFFLSRVPDISADDELREDM